MKSIEKIEVVYKEVKPQSEEEKQIAEQQLEGTYNALFDLLLNNKEQNSQLGALETRRVERATTSQTDQPGLDRPRF
jgi:hypothetical protein